MMRPEPAPFTSEDHAIGVKKHNRNADFQVFGHDGSR